MNFPQLIPNYPIGSDLVILDAVYHYPTKQQIILPNGDTKNINIPDTMTIVYKDNTTGKKGMHVIEHPLYTFYMIKNDVATPTYDMFFTEMDMVDEITCEYRNINKIIAQKLDEYDQTTYNTNLYKQNIANGNGKANNEFQQSKRVFSSDISINNFYRMVFAEQYQNRETRVSRVYLDIEVDGKVLGSNEFPASGECPINAISYFDHDKKELFTFLLNQKNVNPLSEEFCTTVNNQKYNEEFKQFLDSSFGSHEKVCEYQLDNIKTHIVCYDDELTMLTDLFRFINFNKPDFLMVWNMGFDIPFIINRIINLGGDPQKIMCPHTILPQYEHCDYRKDELHDEWSAKGDYADITSYTVYLDQLIQFASRRKGGAQFRSYTLDYIGTEVAGIHKLNYSDIAKNVADLPYADYKRFVMYNMMDVLVQYCIEFKSDDILYVFNKALLNCTEYKKVHRQTVYLANRAAIMFKKFGNYILGNNNNKFKPKPTTKYEGAYVADPNKFADTNKDLVNGKPIMRASNAIDFDFTRLYPSIAQEYNLAPNTQIGYIQIPNKIYKDENRINNEKYTRSGQFIEDFTSDCDLEFGSRWFNLPDFKEAYRDIIYYFNTIEKPFYNLTNDDLASVRNCPIRFKTKSRPIAFIRDYNKALFNQRNNKEHIPEINKLKIISELERKNSKCTLNRHQS